MSLSAEGVVFSPADLVPDAWRSLATAGPVRMFNPGLLQAGDYWLFAYRVVASDGLRRIALCRLDRSLRVVEASHRPLSDEFRFQPDARYPDVVRMWFADPRLYRFGDRIFIYWNSGWHEPQNHQFLHELDAKTLRPIGFARELILEKATRQKLEKNWTLFGSDTAEIRAVYSVTPHRILRGSLEGDGLIALADECSTPWSLNGYPPSHGGLRGGTPPQRTASGYLSFCHSVHDGPTGYRYAACAYRFSDVAPFTPTHRPHGPLPLHNPFSEARIHARLNPAVAEVLYPCGAANDGGRWLISHGINDEHCAITVVTPLAINATLEAI